MPRLFLAPAVAALVLATGAAAQSPPPGPVAEVVIESFTPFNDADTPFEFRIGIRNAGSVPIEEARVRLTIFQRVLSRSSLRASLDGRPQGDVLAATTEQLAEEIAPAGGTTVTVTRSLGALANAFRARRGIGGVYPVEIEVRGSDDTLWTGHAAIVYLPAAPQSRLNLAWILPFHHPPMLEPDATYPAETVDAALGPGGTLAAAASTIPRAAAAGATLVPSGVTLDELAELADGYTRREQGRTLRAEAGDAVPKAAAAAIDAIRAAAAAGAEIASSPYARADLVSLVHGDLTSDAGRQVSAGFDRVRDRLGQAPTTKVFVPADLRIDSRAAATVAGLGMRALVLDAGLTPERTGVFGPDRPVTVSGRGGTRLQALPADAPIRERLEAAAGSDAILVAQSVLAETASAWLERPALAAGRALVVATATTPAAPLIAALAERLGSAPWLETMPASRLLEAVPADEDPQPLALGGLDNRTWAQTVRTARRAVEILRRVLVEPGNAAEDLDALVLAAESADWSFGARSLALARAAKTAADGIVGKIRTAGRHVTLTSRRGRLPVTILNDTGFAIRLRIRLRAVKVAFPDGAERDVEVPGRSETLTIPARALAAGAFPVEVEMRTFDGAYPIGGDELVVRSTAVSLVALVVIGGGGLVLVVAWFRRGRGRRRGSPDRATVAPSPA